MRIGTPLSPSATPVMLLGAGELGKEVIIALQRLGVEVIAVDRYPDAPGHQVAHRSHVIAMSDPAQLRAPRRRVLLALAPACAVCSAFAAPPVIEIEIREHLFYPPEVVIPADTKVKLLVKNLDPTPEEFESYELNREKVISGNSQAVIFIGPLPAGEYPFFGEFYPKTAQGKVRVE